MSLKGKDIFVIIKKLFPETALFMYYEDRKDHLVPTNNYPGLSVHMDSISRLHETMGILEKMAFGIITAIYLCLCGSTSVLAYFATKESMYVAKDFPIFSNNYVVAGYVLMSIAVLTVIGLILMWISLLDLDSRFIRLKVPVGRLLIIGLACVTSGVVLGAGALNFQDRNASVMAFAIFNYQKENRSTEAINQIQNEYSCCGISGYQDWKFNSLFTCASSMSPLTCGIPQSCCKNKTMIKKAQIYDMFCGLENLKRKDGVWRTGENGTSEITPSEIMHLEGCLSKFDSRLHDSAKKVLIYAFLLLLIQCFSIILQYFSSCRRKIGRQRACSATTSPGREETEAEAYGLF